MESNRRALTILLALVLTSLILFCAEKKFLVSEPRGATLSAYNNLAWVGKIIFLIEDFEGFNEKNLDLTKENFFSYGSTKIAIDNSKVDNSLLSSRSALKVQWTGSDNYGGWGKGIGANIDLDSSKDFLNFRIYIPGDTLKEETLKITLEEDDNDDGKLQKDKDDAWFYNLTITNNDKWKLISIPLKDFRDDNEGGDHQLNVTRKGGLHTIIFSFQHPEKYTVNRTWYFDFICFSNEEIPNDNIIR